ncbi:MAG: DUF4248 domain-containing protein [Tannerellaceae bacterium]|nr:DUF4248 domain-containing protein [Tannerellaceae bacterium]
MIDEELNFKPKTYGLRELASLYCPDIHPKSAARKLKGWILRNSQLCSELRSIGWEENYRLFTPNQVQVIVRYLGEP